MGQEVLARWSDDGWYYVGVILKPDGDDRYYVGDSTGYIESILTEDLIGDINSEFKVIQVYSKTCLKGPLENRQNKDLNVKR